MFPGVFVPNMTHPYDGFKIEDFDMVDNGIIEHLYPLLQENEPSWDVIIGHFSGVDHVGHRVGPNHPAMKVKLQHMNSMLRDVVSLLDDETLLVLLGDHGMDRRGNHGCDTEHEVSSGVWIYTKKRTFPSMSLPIPPSLLPTTVFPAATVPHRAIQQIDLAPTLSLLLGLPIPSNNLGSVIPEMFWDDGSGQTYDRALRLNAAQVHRYIQTYGPSLSQGGLDRDWEELGSLWERALPHLGSLSNEISPDDWTTIREYLDTALVVCRSSWIQFNFGLIALGFVLLILETAGSWMLWHKLSSFTDSDVVDLWARKLLRYMTRASAAGFIAALVILSSRPSFLPAVGGLQLAIFITFLFPTIALVALTCPPLSGLYASSSKTGLKYIPVLLLFHAVSFVSASYVIWEDHITTFILLGALVKPILAGFRAPTSQLRRRILALAAIFAICVRLMAASTVCREEQHPWCTATFFTSDSLTSPPILVRLLAFPSIVILPYFIIRVLQISQSDDSHSFRFYSRSLPIILGQGCLAWTLEWIEVSDITPIRSALLRPLRTFFGWSAIASALFAGYALWQTKSLRRTEAKSTSFPQSDKPGPSNAYDSSYLALWCIALGIIYPMNQLSAQIVLVLATVALVSYLEMTSGIREARALEAHHVKTLSYASTSKIKPETWRYAAPSVRFSEVGPLAVLALHGFYATGHQMTISSVQWKTAFVLTPTLNLVVSLATLLINECGAIFLLALSAPLLALWRSNPPARPSAARTEGLRASLAMILYHSVLVLSSAVVGVVYRKHPMIWKVFAPRFITAASTLVVVDLASLLAIGLIIPRVYRLVG